MKIPQNFLAADVNSLYAQSQVSHPAAPYVFNEGQLNLRVIQERSMHILTLAQADGVPLTLSLSRGTKEVSDTLHDAVQQQLQAVAQDALHFQQQPLQELHFSRGVGSSGWKPQCLFTEVTYQLESLPVHQGVAVIQLNDHYLLFVTLTHPQGFNEATRQEWLRILNSFVPREAVLPEPGGDLFGGDDDDEENDVV